MSANRKLSYVGRHQTPILCCLGVIAGLFGCAPVHYIALKPEHASTITSTRVHATVVQDQVIGAIESSKAGMFLGGGLLSAIVDAAVNSHRGEGVDKLLVSIHKELSDLDFREMYFASLQKTLPALRALRTANLITNKAPPTPELLEAARARMTEDTFLSLETSYRLSPGFHAFSITTTAELSRNGEDKPLYRGTFVYMTDPIPGDDPEDVAPVWASNHAATLRAAIREGIDETMKMLILDLGTPPVTPARALSARGKAAVSPATRTSGSSAARASASPAVNVSSSAPKVVAPESAPAVSASPTLASPAAAAPEDPGSVRATSTTTAAAASPTAAAAAPPITAAPASLATPAVASPATAAPASLTTPAAASPTTAVNTSPTAAAPVSPASGTQAPASAGAMAPTARAKAAREIVRRDNGIMYSVPRSAPPVDEGAR